MAAYQTFLRDCDCERGGILFKDNTPCCRWCRTPYAKGGMINYDDEHFTHSVKSGKGTANDVLNTEEKKKAMKSWIAFMPEGIDPREVTANDVLNTEETIDDFWKRHNIGVNDNIGRFRESFHSSDKSLNTGKEWEVVEVIEDEFFGRISNHLNHSLELRVKEGHAKIKSVKRLSDNEVFSVGEKVSVEGEYTSFIIVGFQISGSHMMATFTPSEGSGLVSASINYLIASNKIPSPTPSQPQNNKERIEMNDMAEHVSTMFAQMNWYQIHFTKKIDYMKEYKAIKTAIEKIINHE